MCMEHWTAMRTKVEELGLSHLVASSGTEAVDRAVRELEAAQEGEKALASDFDPLMAMNWAFQGRVMETLGLGVMANREEQDGMPENRDDGGFNHLCPLCVVRRDFDTHNTPTGKCSNSECNIEVKPGDKPWDKKWIDGCGDAQYQHAVELGLVKLQ